MLAKGPFGFPLLAIEPRCPACAAPRVRPLHVYPNRRRAIARSEELVMTGCEACGIVWTSPLPPAALVDAFYAGDGEGWKERSATLSREADAAQREDRVQRKLTVKRATCARERDLLLPQLEGLPAVPSVLDFGCGIGAWLDVLADVGWRTVGLEPGATARSIAARRHAMVDVVPSVPTYDLVILQHVLEHVRDLAAIVASVATATRKGGYVFVSSPDLGRLGEHLKLGYVSSGVHLFGFTATSLGALLGRAGLEPVQVFDGPEWNVDEARAAMRLKLLARRTATPIAPPERPLQPALDALREFASRQRELRAGEIPRHPPTAREKALDLLRLGAPRRRRRRRARGGAYCGPSPNV